MSSGKKTSILGSNMLNFIASMASKGEINADIESNSTTKTDQESMITENANKNQNFSESQSQKLALHLNKELQIISDEEATEADKSKIEIEAIQIDEATKYLSIYILIIQFK